LDKNQKEFPAKIPVSNHIRLSDNDVR